MSLPLRVVEWFCGIGGCSAALAGKAQVVMAVDVSRKCLGVYAQNFSNPATAPLIETLAGGAIAAWNADLWWLSPPCQPYTRRGHGRDVDDPRAASLLKLIECLADVRPRYVALENVPPFGESRARGRLVAELERLGYAFQETLLCPAELGIPNRRRRYYLVASRDGGLLPWRFRTLEPVNLRLQLDPAPPESLWLPADFFAQYRYAIHVVDPLDNDAVTTCFTAAYGRSRVLSGSYLMTERGLRHFSPAEILRLLGFPANFSLPPDMTERQAWPLVGNSLSVAAVRQVLAAIPELAALADWHP